VIGAALIVGGYVAVIWTFGWPGLLVAAAHVAVLLAGMWRRPP
jgi:hypothetical protein